MDLVAMEMEVVVRNATIAVTLSVYVYYCMYRVNYLFLRSYDDAHVLVSFTPGYNLQTTGSEQ